MTPEVRPLGALDFEAWLPLWDDYNTFYRNEYSGAVLGIGTPLFIGIVAMLLGIVLMALSWYANPKFFRNPLSATPVEAPGRGETREGR